ncbi:MAG: hypothetical protein AAGA99_19820 [Actinomycetota bacterium]
MLVEASIDRSSDVVPVELRPTLLITDGGVQPGPCVAYAGTIVESGAELRLEQDPEAGFGFFCEEQGRLREALERADTVRFADDWLELVGEDVELRFERPAPVPDAVFDRDWVLVSWVPTLQDELVPAVSEATLRFDSDGTFEGTSGCERWFRGTWKPSFDGFRFPRFDIEGPCPGPNLDPLVDQHGLLTALGLGARPVLVGDELHLLWAPLWTDRVAFAFEEAPGPEEGAGTMNEGSEVDR